MNASRIIILLYCSSRRLLEYAPQYFDLDAWNDEHRKGETFKAIKAMKERLMGRRGKADGHGADKKDKKRKTH